MPRWDDTRHIARAYLNPSPDVRKVARYKAAVNSYKYQQAREKQLAEDRAKREQLRYNRELERARERAEHEVTRSTMRMIRWGGHTTRRFVGGVRSSVSGVMRGVDRFGGTLVGSGTFDGILSVLIALVLLAGLWNVMSAGLETPVSQVIGDPVGASSYIDVNVDMDDPFVSYGYIYAPLDKSIVKYGQFTDRQISPRYFDLSYTLDQVEDWLDVDNGGVPLTNVFQYGVNAMLSVLENLWTDVVQPGLDWITSKL